MLTFSQKRFFVSFDELALFMEPDIKLSMIAWASEGHGGKTEICPPLGNWDYQTNISGKNWSASFRLIELILAMTVFFCRYETHTAQESGSQL